MRIVSSIALRVPQASPARAYALHSLMIAVFTSVYGSTRLTPALSQRMRENVHESDGQAR